LVCSSENWELPWQLPKAELGTKNIELPEGSVAIYMQEIPSCLRQSAMTKKEGALAMTPLFRHCEARSAVAIYKQKVKVKVEQG